MTLIILFEIIIQPNSLPTIQFLWQVATFDINDFFLQKTIFAVKMLHHLVIYFIGNITPVHHNDVLHSIYTIGVFIVVACLCYEFEQQIRTVLVIYLRLFTKLWSKSLFWDYSPQSQLRLP